MTNKNKVAPNTTRKTYFFHRENQHQWGNKKSNVHRTFLSFFAPQTISNERKNTQSGEKTTSALSSFGEHLIEVSVEQFISLHDFLVYQNIILFRREANVLGEWILFSEILRMCYGRLYRFFASSVLPVFWEPLGHYSYHYFTFYAFRFAPSHILWLFELLFSWQFISFGMNNGLEACGEEKVLLFWRKKVLRAAPIEKFNPSNMASDYIIVPDGMTLKIISGSLELTYQKCWLLLTGRLL